MPREPSYRRTITTEANHTMNDGTPDQFVPNLQVGREPSRAPMIQPKIIPAVQREESEQT